jgi:hypothetical protein
MGLSSGTINAMFLLVFATVSIGFAISCVSDMPSCDPDMDRDTWRTKFALAIVTAVLAGGFTAQVMVYVADGDSVSGPTYMNRPASPPSLRA